MASQALLVLGMHRSGTSALAGLLVRLGVQAPRTLMEPAQDNPLGFWESKALFDFHERLLRSAETSWDSWTRIDPEWFSSAQAGQLAGEFRQLLDQEYGGASLFVVKDPRICRFVPFWLRNLGDHVEAKVVIIVRSPGDIVASLEARDALRPQQSLLMWLRHVLDAERETRSITRSFVRYGDLLDDWREAAARLAADLAIEWPRGVESAEAEISGFLRPDLCHHTEGIDGLDVGSPLSDWVRRASHAFDLLIERDEARTAEALATLDDLRRELDDASSLFGRVFERERHQERERTAGLEAARERSVRLAAECEALNRTAAGLEAERRILQQTVASMEAEHEALRGQVVQVEAARDAARDHASGLEAERHDLRLQAADLERRSSALARQLAGARHQVDALLASGSWRLTAPLRLLWRLFVRPRGSNEAAPSGDADRDP